MSIENLQVINLADNINAAIDKMNENFDLTKVEMNNIVNYIDSSALNYLQNNLEVSAIVDSQDILDVLASINLDARIDSIDGGILAIAELVTQLEVDYSNLESGLNANTGAIQGLTSSIAITDSNVTVLSQSVTDLEATLAGNIQVDSDLIVQAVGGALELLETRIDYNSDEINVVSQSILDLDADLRLLDSNLQTQITLSAAADQQILAQVTANDSGLSALSGQFGTFEARLDSAIASGLTITPEEVSSAVGGITDDLYALIHANSDSISVITNDVLSLESKLTLLDSNGALSDVISTAVSDLRTEVIYRDSDNLATAISEFTTALGSYVDSSTFATAEQTLRTEITSGDSDALASAISEFETRLEGYVDSGSFGSAVQTLNLRIDDAVTEVGYTLNLNANGHVAGIEFNNDGATADMVIVADKFGIVNASNNAVKPFTINGDNVELSNATVTGSLNISSTGNNGSMTMTNDVMQIFDGSNNLRVKFGRLA